MRMASPRRTSLGLASFAVALLLPHVALASGHKTAPPCVSATEASQHPNTEVCVSAHIYEVFELSDGSRFLDVCPQALADNDCRFFILSLPEDRETVGPLRQYKDMDVRIRGVIRPMHGRMGMLLSHVRQFSGGQPRFKPNPLLLKGFNAQSERMPVHDPNLAPSGRGRTFMNNQDKITLSDKKP